MFAFLKKLYYDILEYFADGFYTCRLDGSNRDRFNRDGGWKMGMTEKLSQTMKIQAVDKASKPEAEEILMGVYAALNEKGYNPVSQIVGYILSGDPTYITGYNGARSLITKVERDELLEKLVRNFIDSNAHPARVKSAAPVAES